ncbi:hypothetical protein [Aurantibacillus circumpalustris]|uniref:hypothetical protein n=1 Tax=Aurantibacillus circumpalustris TaxID=3036359 RepID=UPI00295AFE47|nr:hypothetical protein [Aurantibacillus circumpalustris]
MRHLVRSIYYIAFLSILLLSACGKKDKPPENNTPVPPIVETPVEEFKCEDLPLPPPPFEWIDSLEDGNKNINAFLFDPVNSNKIIMVVNGDALGSNKLLFYDIPSKTAKYIYPLGKYLPQVNNKGWITFSDSQNNIFVVKNSGDSLIALTNDNHAHNPYWDYTGNVIYYFSEGYFNVPPKMMKINVSGNFLLEFEAELPYLATFKKSDKLLTLKVNSNTCDVYYTDFENQSNNRTLISGPVYSKAGQINFDNLTLDKTDENFYWSNSNGIFKCNIASLKVDTIFKTCQNSIYDNPIVSFGDNELTFSLHTIKPLNVFTLYHRYLAMELNTLTGRSVEIKVFP